jgi:uncharacterized SAM-binding protein YcdF (DUF218 family)
MPSLSYSALTPPTVFIVSCLIAALMALRFRRSGTIAMIFSAGLLYLSALPVVARGFSQYLALPLPNCSDLRKAQAIVVLGAGMHVGDGGRYPDQLDALSLERLARAADLYQKLDIPIAVTGGRLSKSTSSLGALMKRQLEQGSGIPVTWSEEASRNTFENAELTARELRQSSVDRVILVTNPWHLARAVWSFERAGLRALPYPTSPPVPRPLEWTDFLPNLGALRETSYALHEILGLAYYRLRY